MIIRAKVKNSMKTPPFIVVEDTHQWRSKVGENWHSSLPVSSSMWSSNLGSPALKLIEMHMTFNLLKL